MIESTTSYSVHVTSQIMAKAKRCNSKKCAVALALDDAGVNCKHVYHGFMEIEKHNVYIPQELQSWIYSWDGGCDSYEVKFVLTRTRKLYEVLYSVSNIEWIAINQKPHTAPPQSVSTQTEQLVPLVKKEAPSEGIYWFSFERNDAHDEIK